MTPSSHAAPAATRGLHILEEKPAAKRAFQEAQGWPAEPRRALLCIPTGVSDALGGALLMEMLPGLLQMPVQIAVLGKGPASYGQKLTELARQHGHRLTIVPDAEQARAAMLLAADMSLFLIDPQALPELDSCRRVGAVPVALRTGALQNYDPNQESGTAFLYDSPTVWHAFAAVVRALETYRFPYDWKTIQKHDLT